MLNGFQGSKSIFYMNYSKDLFLYYFYLISQKSSFKVTQNTQSHFFQGSVLENGKQNFVFPLPLSSYFNHSSNVIFKLS